MKTFIKYTIIISFVISTVAKVFAQQTTNNHLPTDSLTSHSVKEVSLLDKAKIEPYWLTVTYDKTSHLIFPSKIRYVDLGSEYLSAGKADGVDNVLRIKAAVQNFEPETNFSVITEDGKFYNFDVFYSSAPAVLTYDLLKMKQVEKQKKSEVLFGELEGYSPSVAELIMKTIYQQNKKIVKNIDSDNYGIAFSLKGIYVHQGKLYFHTALNNKSNLPFIIDAVIFSIVDKKKAKKTILQDQTLSPLRIYKVLDKVMESSEENNVFMMEQFTLTKDKILLIEIYEKNGDRNQLLKVKVSDLSNAKIIDL
ncbi:conjugative transposon protein TraN [Elizabethkingia anophelis]|uniref:Conjugative transposon protein TraN n=1 Tax=Elizabethkingia anophelis TaxID=1117645 RepID=A0A455ZEQ5_9FLAO|nr:conjugative transposon protein TraN [Elizabethkingia anophelis]MCL1689645.1 conjugative transposon protein TraN [Elizabethkingia anophelis]MDV3953464.1 conjugative transposon protein TraN [Elizabethkingia anophelis]MDV4011774.1 conjugative transposon protein TraN [Elizabethkingia anophelis]MYY47712.1 conjugative transposon protein TraN [Elizabethkingia anophelis]DAC75343.1 TPA_exp: conjugative transposon protein TraN [Elizabethkingia anophelis]